MSDVVFREPQQSATELEAKAVKSDAISSSNVEVPYLDYEKTHGKPYLADLFELGDRWNDGMGGFEEEIKTIEEYLESQVTNREVENSLKSIEKRLKEIEKVTNMDKEDRKVVKLEVLAQYVKFLMKTNDIKRNITRYGSN